MNVFNLTQQELNYRGRVIPPNGGSLEYPELDKGGIPSRDRKLEEKKVLAFGKLPYWWVLEQKVKSSTLTRTQLAARDDARIARLDKVAEQVRAGEKVDVLKVAAGVVMEKIQDELRTESQVRSAFKVTPVALKDRGYGGKGRHK